MYLEGIWKVFGRYSKGIQKIFISYLEGTRKIGKRRTKLEKDGQYERVTTRTAEQARG